MPQRSHLERENSGLIFLTHVGEKLIVHSMGFQAPCDLHIFFSVCCCYACWHFMSLLIIIIMCIFMDTANAIGNVIIFRFIMQIVHHISRYR